MSKTGKQIIQNTLHVRVSSWWRWLHKDDRNITLSVKKRNMFFHDLTAGLLGNNSKASNNTDTGNHAPEVSAKALAVTSVTNGFLLLVSLLIFSFLRNKFPRIYTPRLLLNGLDSSIGRLPNNLLGWLVPAFRVKDEELLGYLGLDALMFLRLLRLGFMFGILILPYGLIVTLPVN